MVSYHYGAGETISNSNGAYNTNASPASGMSTLRHHQTSTPNNITVSGGSRKRASPTSISGVANNKRSKGGKKAASTVASSTPATASGASSVNSSHSSTTKRHSDNEENDTIDKRNLHNDMERQRRIGLKNLFENLKDKIPSLREKDRAPKVNILREATSLCNKLTRDDTEYETLKRRQQRLVQRLKQARQAVALLRGNVNVV